MITSLWEGPATGTISNCHLQVRHSSKALRSTRYRPEPPSRSPIGPISVLLTGEYVTGRGGRWRRTGFGAVDAAQFRGRIEQIGCAGDKPCYRRQWQRVRLLTGRRGNSPVPRIRTHLEVIAALRSKRDDAGAGWFSRALGQLPKYFGSRPWRVAAWNSAKSSDRLMKV